MKKVFLIYFILCFFLSNPLKSFEIMNLAKIDDKVITNLDLYYEIKLREIFGNKKINNLEGKIILNQLIDQKIKAIEVDNNKIDYNIKIITNELNNRLKFINFENINLNYEEKKIVKNRLFNKLQIDYRWNRLIVMMYAGKLSINLNEINKISKSKNLNNEQKEKLIEEEKNKKIQLFSKMHFLKIKRKYYIKLLK